MEPIDIFEIIGAISTIYTVLLYLLPPTLAKKLKPIGVILNAIANTPGGFKINKRR